jgi:uracil phosphoribosyltransferase
VSEFPNLTVLDHPLILHKLTVLRDRRTSKKKFKEVVDEIAMLMAYEVTKELPLEAVEIETPLERTTQWMISGKKLVIVPILRAGLGMVDGVARLMPSARVGHIGLYRDPKTLVAVEYYYKVPGNLADRDVIVCDPMLATGNSAVAAVERIKRSKPGSLKMVSLLACPEGLEHFHHAHPDVHVVTAAVDEKLNDHGYIIPGLGDAGDRLFGTK